MPLNYYKAVEKIANNIIKLGEDFKKISQTPVTSWDKLIVVTNAFQIQLDKALKEMKKFEQIKAPANIIDKNSILINLLNEYLNYTQKAVNSLKIKDKQGIEDSLNGQQKTSTAIVELCKTF